MKIYLTGTSVALLLLAGISAAAAQDNHPARARHGYP